MTIKLTKHAKLKIEQRKLSLDDINRIVEKPDLIEYDKFDKSLIHYIGRVEDKFLRIIGRWESRDAFLIISAFFDRRLKRRSDDKD